MLFIKNLYYNKTYIYYIIESVYPSHIYFVDVETGEELNNSRIIIGGVYKLSVRVKYGIALSYSFNNLPPSLIYDKKYFTLTGIIPESIQNFRIIAYSADGSFLEETIVFNFINTCENNMKRHAIRITTDIEIQILKISFILNQTYSGYFYRYYEENPSLPYFMDSFCSYPGFFKINLIISPLDTYTFVYYIDGLIINVNTFIIENLDENIGFINTSI